MAADVASSSLADLKSQIETAPLVACNQTSWELLGLSMPFWNGVTGLALALGMTYMVRIGRSKP